MAFLDENGNEVKAEDFNAPGKEIDTSPGWFEPGSKSEAVVRGATNAATLGTGKYFAGLMNSLRNGGSAKDAVQEEVKANQESMDKNPLSYGAGNILGGAPMGFAGAGKGLITNLATNIAAPTVTTLADTQDPVQAAKAGVMGAVIPGAVAAFKPVASVVSKTGGKVLDKVSDAIGVPGAATEQVANDVGKFGTTGGKITIQAKQAKLDPTEIIKRSGGEDYTDQLNKAIIAEAKKTGINPDNPAFREEFAKTFKPTLNQSLGVNLKSDVLTNGVDAVPDELKTFIASGTPNPGPWDIIKNGYKGMGIGAVAGGQGGAMVGMPGTGAVLGGAVGGAGAIKKTLVNREIHKQLGTAAVEATSPAAKQGTSLIRNMTAKAGDVVQNPGRFGVISNFLNQTSPSARAALNPDNPLNGDQLNYSE